MSLLLFALEDEKKMEGLKDNVGPSPLVDFIAGTVGGIASLIAGHPFDTIKTRLQAQSHAPTTTSSTGILGNVAVAGSSSSAGGSLNGHNDLFSSSSVHSPLLQSNRGVGNHGAATTTAILSPSSSSTIIPRYTSAFDALRRIVSEERFIGLYKGITSPILGVAVMNASVFGVYGLALRSLDSFDHAKNSSFSSPSITPSTLSNIFLAGCISGLISSFITTPIELIKIRQQLFFDKNKIPTVWQVTQMIWKKDGLRGIYRGLGTSSIRDLGYGPYFFSYELMNRTLLSFHDHQSLSTIQKPQLTNVEMAISGGLAGVIGWCSTFAIDVIKTRVQATDIRFDQQQLERMARMGESNKSILNKTAFMIATKQIYREGGYSAFFAGIGPTILRAIPANAVLFLAFEYTKDSLTKMGL